MIRRLAVWVSMLVFLVCAVALCASYCSTVDLSTDKGWLTIPINLDKAREFVAELERDTDRVQVYHGELESLIAQCMEEVYQLAKQGETERKLELVGIEYRARLVLERFRRNRSN